MAADGSNIGDGLEQWRLTRFEHNARQDPEQADVVRTVDTKRPFGTSGAEQKVATQRGFLPGGGHQLWLEEEYGDGEAGIEWQIAGNRNDIGCDGRGNEECGNKRYSEEGV